MTFRATLTAPLALLLAACSPASAPPSSAPPSPQATTAGADASHGPAPAVASAGERAQAAAQDFAGTLRTQLRAKMAEGGPVAAVEFCAAEAPKIAADKQQAHGVALGRVPVAGRMRNTANAPGDWQAAVLQDFQARADAGEAPASLVFRQAEDLPAGVALRMARGIEVEPGCLACHGPSVVDTVKAAIARHYPDDTATGFNVGDLRGLLWVEVPASAQ